MILLCSYASSTRCRSIPAIVPHVAIVFAIHLLQVTSISEMLESKHQSLGRHQPENPSTWCIPAAYGYVVSAECAVISYCEVPASRGCNLPFGVTASRPRELYVKFLAEEFATSESI